METKIINLSKKQLNEIERRLEKFDAEHIKFKLSGNVSLGIMLNGELVAGADGCITAFRIFYLSTLFVDEKVTEKS